jgi:site-specific DNA-methyltransferase (adenine-specific)
MTFRLITGDCIEAMQEMDESSVDAIVTDPPYGLEFMGKEWDRFTDADLAIRSGHERAISGGGFTDANGIYPKARNQTGVKFGGTWTAECRGCGRRDMFRKGCRCETPDWVRVKTNGNAPLLAYQSWTVAWATEALRVLKPGAHLLSFGGTRTYHRLTCALEDAGFEIRDCLAWLYGSGFPKSLNIGDGYGTALKPAFEPIVLARKPLSERNVAANVQRWGTGALNIDGCRIEGKPASFGPGTRKRGGIMGEPDGQMPAWSSDAGRWPANVILDEQAAEMLDQQTGERRSAGLYPTTVQGSPGLYGGHIGVTQGPLYADSGGASRFFYVPKADREERNRGLYGFEEDLPLGANGSPNAVGTTRGSLSQPRANVHPTVKPVELMQWLCRMVTPPHGLVLDPFLGSGTTGIAALREGFEFIGIEREPDYVEIARARIVGDGPLFNVEAQV